MIEIDVSGADTLGGVPSLGRIERLLGLAFASAGVAEGHVAVDIVDDARITALNREHRDIDRPTDVLSFPVDGAEPVAGPRELGDIVICPPRCESVERALVHGALHLIGMDHEVDGGEMLALEAEILRWEEDR